MSDTPDAPVLVLSDGEVLTNRDVSEQMEAVREALAAASKSIADEYGPKFAALAATFRELAPVIEQAKTTWLRFRSVPKDGAQ